MSEVEGYLGYKVTSAEGLVGRFFLDLRKPRAKPVGLRFLIRKTHESGALRFLKIKKMHESGRSVFLNMRPVRVDVLY